MDAKTVARIFGCTEEQARAAYARNATQLATMRDKAIRTRRKVNGYTAEELARHAATYAAKAVA